MGPSRTSFGCRLEAGLKVMRKSLESAGTESHLLYLEAKHPSWAYVSWSIKLGYLQQPFVGDYRES